MRRAYNSPGLTIKVGEVDGLAYVVYRRDGAARFLELLFVDSSEFAFVEDPGDSVVEAGALALTCRGCYRRIARGHWVQGW